MNNILYQPIIKIKYYVYTYKSLFPSTELISSNNVLQKRKKNIQSFDPLYGQAVSMEKSIVRNIVGCYQNRIITGFFRE